MTSIRLSPAELSALVGLPFVAVVLYVLGIRPRMDYRTGTVGVSPRVSWQALSEDVRVYGQPGIASETLSRFSLRRAALHLVRAGLLAIHSDSNARELVFECLAADVDSSVPNKAARKPHETRTTRSRRVTEEEMAEGQGEPARHPSEKPHSIRVPVSSNHHHHPMNGIGEGSSGAEGAEPPAALEGDGPPLDWSLLSRLSGQQREAIAATPLPGGTSGQAILDELCGQMRCTTIRNPVTYARRIIATAIEEGERWAPTWSAKIAAERVAGVESGKAYEAAAAARDARRLREPGRDVLDSMPEAIARRVRARQAGQGGADVS